MAHMIKQVILILALAIFAGACAKQAKLEYPTQPEPETISQEPLETKEFIPPPPGSLGEQAEKQKAGLEQQIKDNRETRSERNERLDKLKQEQLEDIVYNETPEEIRIRERANEIDLENARRKAQVAKEVGDTPSMRKAREEAAKAKREEEKLAKVQRKALSRAALSNCDPATVDIKPYGQNFHLFNMFPVTLVIRVINTGPTAVTIETPFHGYGPVVENLCAGGSINVGFELRWEDSQTVQIPLLVRSTLPNGRVVTESRQYYLSKYNANYNRVTNEIWTVNLANR